MDKITHEWYESNADRFAEMTTSLDSFPGLKADLQHFISRLNDDSIVADLGSGACRDARFIAAAGHKVIALDTSLSLLKRGVVGLGRRSGVHAVLADLESLPFSEQSLDAIWACGSLLHLQRPIIPKVLSTCYETMKPRGMIALSLREGSGAARRVDSRRLETYVSKAQLSAWLYAARFIDVEIIGPSPNGWLFATAAAQ